MDILRTPAERFENLPDFAYSATMVDVGDGLQMAIVDEGPRDAQPVLLMHGEPTWAYLYRFMIPMLVDAGHRVVVPDLIGFGRSDKPTQLEDHSYAKHVRWTHEAVINQLALRDIVLFCQDWGGLIGLRMVCQSPDRFARLIVSNTGMPDGQGSVGEAFAGWKQFVLDTPDLPIGLLINGGTQRDMAPEEVAAYDAPFPDPSYKAGTRALPLLVPTEADDPGAIDNRAAWPVLEAFDRPVILAFSDKDPITAGGDAIFVRRVEGTKGQPHVTIADGGHFVQEDQPAALVRVILGS
jgi:haloalkane dehalogenase